MEFILIIFALGILSCMIFMSLSIHKVQKNLEEISKKELSVNVQNVNTQTTTQQSTTGNKEADEKLDLDLLKELSKFDKKDAIDVKMNLEDTKSNVDEKSQNALEFLKKKKEN